MFIIVSQQRINGLLVDILSALRGKGILLESNADESNESFS